MKKIMQSLIVATVLYALPLIVFAQPQVIITPSSGAPATIIKIEGKGFQPNEEIDIIITLDEGEKVILGTEKIDVVKTDSGGSFSVQSGIPINAKQGKHKIEIFGNKGSKLEVFIEVTPRK
jgi:hypothetical protein